MKVIEITGEPILHGGQEQFLKNLIENIDTRDLQIDVLTPHYCENEHFRKLVQDKGGNVYELNLDFRPGKSRRLLLNPIKDFLKGKNYDVAHIHSGSISVLAYEAKASRDAGIRKVIVHSHSTGVSTIKHKVIRFLFGMLIRKNATDYLACSEEAGRMKYSPKIVKEKLVVIKNGINIENFRYTESKREYIRRTTGIEQGSVVFGHVGRFSEEKNHQFLIDVFSKVHAIRPDSCLMLVGDGELKEEIEKEVHYLGMTDSVRFTGNVNNVQDYYSAMNVFVFPSVFEGLPYVTLEAQAAGIPCVVSTGVPEAVVMADNAFRLDLSDKQKWTDKMISLIGETPTDNSEIIRHAGYDIKVTAEQVKKLYLQ